MSAVMDIKVKCRLCGCRLDDSEEDDFTHEVCSSCSTRPEVKLLGIPGLKSVAPPARGTSAARDFTPAEKALIRKVHGYMPHAQLLAILTERLTCDLGPDAAQYTLYQLSAQIGDQITSAPTGGHDWGSLRPMLGIGRASGWA